MLNVAAQLVVLRWFPAYELLGRVFQLPVHHLPHYKFLDLAGEGHRVLSHETHMAGDFEMADPVPAELF